MKSIVLGRCKNCSIDDANSGRFGYYMSVDNCTSDGNCDIYVNVQNKRHECPKTKSLTDCLASPAKLQNYIVDNNGRGILREYTTSSDISDAIYRGEGIQGTEITQTLLSRMVSPCGKGLSDINNGPNNPGCFPYSDNVFDDSVKCPSGNTTMYSSCCNDSSCSGTCNPCSVRIKYLNENVTWKNDLCYYLCPGYWRQRIIMQGSGAIDESQICNSEYAELCKISGCDIDPVCMIKWGGGYDSNLHPYSNIDSDLCNGLLSSVDIMYSSTNECTSGTNVYVKNYCNNNKLCSSGGTAKNKTIGYPKRLLPTVSVGNLLGRPISIGRKQLTIRNGNFVSNIQYSLYNDNGTIVFKKGTYTNFILTDTYEHMSGFYNANVYKLSTIDGLVITSNPQPTTNTLIAISPTSPASQQEGKFQKVMVEAISSHGPQNGLQNGLQAGNYRLSFLDSLNRTIGYLGANISVSDNTIPQDTYPALLIQYPNDLSVIEIT